MPKPSPFTLTIELDREQALRIARFEVETGIAAEQLLLTAVQEWESGQRYAPFPPTDGRVQVQFIYRPRTVGSVRTVVTKGLYDAQEDAVEITDSQFPTLIGLAGSPSTMAIAVVKQANPKIGAANRNGQTDWKEIGTNRSVKEVRKSLKG